MRKKIPNSNKYTKPRLKQRKSSERIVFSTESAFLMFLSTFLRETWMAAYTSFVAMAILNNSFMKQVFTAFFASPIANPILRLCISFL